MIVSPDGGRLVSSLGWVDQGGLVAWDTHGDRPPHWIALSDARYLSLHQGRNGLFSVVHHFEAFDHLAITAHSFEAPERPLSTYRIRNSRVALEGPQEPWAQLETFYVSYLHFGGLKEACLISLDQRGGAAIEPLDWFDDRYDKGYQGITGVYSIPDSSHLMFGIQRCSEPVIYDPRHKRVVQRLELAGQYGNCDIQFSADRGELWALDYDTLVVLELGSWRRLRARQVQPGEAGGKSRHFAGNYCFHDAGRLCSVALPFSGAVATLEGTTLETLQQTACPDQPLDLAVVGQEVFVRDWKSGTPTRRPLGSG